MNASDPTNGPTWVYQAICEHGALLYVGVAYDIPRRIAQHRSTKPWWPDVDVVLGTLWPTRQEALSLEGKIIRGVMPPHNIAGKPRRPERPSDIKWRTFDGRGCSTGSSY